MTTSLANTQIATVYDTDETMTVDALAMAFGFDIDAIKMVLAAHSQRFRKELSATDIFNEDDRKLAGETLKQLLFAENEGVRAKVAMSILDRDKKGESKALKNTAKAAGGINIHILQQYVIKSRERIKEIKGEVLDVQAA